MDAALSRYLFIYLFIIHGTSFFITNDYKISIKFISSYQVTNKAFDNGQ